MVDPQVLTHVRGAVFVLNPAGEVLFWNRAAEQVFGYSAAAILGTPWWKGLGASAAELLRADFASASADHPFHGHYEVRHADGGPVRAQFRFSPWTDPEGRPGGWLVTAEPEPPPAPLPAGVRDPSAVLTAAVNAIKDAVVVLDAARRVVFLNTAAERMLGEPATAVLGAPLSVSAALVATLEPLLAAPRTSGRDLARTRGTFQGRRANGESFPLEAAITDLTLEGQSYLTILLRDVSALQQRQHALEQSQRMLAIGALASGVAHDFNNILTAILSHLDLVACDPDLAESTRASVTYAQTSARRGAELVGKLLAFSRQSETRIEPTNLYDLSLEVVAMLRRSIDRRIQIRHELLTPALWTVNGDRSQLMQLLMNLCLNARDAMPTGGELAITLANAERTDLPLPAAPPATQFVKLTVSDTGVGMAPEVIARLFEPYFTTKPIGKGTGLGLSIAYSVVTEYGGTIEVESAPHCGSRFHVYLPRARVATEDAAPVAEAAAPSVEGTERILVVDDDEMIRMVVRAVLSYRGYQVLEAENGEEALSKYATAQPGVDLVLLDLNMPGLNGWDTLLRLREQNPRVTVLLLSGGVTEGESDKAREAGAAGFLIKPFENQEMVRLVRQTLDQARLRPAA